MWIFGQFSWLVVNDGQCIKDIFSDAIILTVTIRLRTKFSFIFQRINPILGSYSIRYRC